MDQKAERLLEFAFQKETWNPELDERLRELFAAGLDDGQLAQELGVSIEATIHRRRRLELFRYRPPSNANRWTDELIERLRNLWDEGLSASVIGLQIGFTRNAVLGKAFRLCLHKRGQGRPAGIPRGEKRKPREARSRSRTFKLHPHVRIVVDNTPDEQTPLAQRKTLMELTADTCRWPVGDPREPSFFFCGGESAGFTYCPKHTAMSRTTFKSVGSVASRVVEKLAQRRTNAQPT